MLKFILLMLLSIPVYAQSSSSSSSVGKFDLRFGWKIPTGREDGAPFAATEILGYEVRYRRLTDTEYRYIPLPYPTLLKYQINKLDYNDYRVEIAVYDLNGIYSQFVGAEFVRPPMPVNFGILKPSLIR